MAQIIITPPDDRTSRLVAGVGSALQARKEGQAARDTAALERDKLENAIQRTEIGARSALDVANVGADVRREISDQAGVEAALNREVERETAQLQFNAQAEKDRAAQAGAASKQILDLMRIQNEMLAESNRNLLGQMRLTSDEDARDLEELQGNMAVGIAEGSGVDEDVRGQPIVSARTWAAYNTAPRTADRFIVEDLIKRSTDPTNLARSRDNILSLIESAIDTPRSLFESPTLGSGEPNPSFNDAAAYLSGIKEASREFKKNLGEYVLGGLLGEEQVRFDLELRKEENDAQRAFNSELLRLGGPTPTSLGTEFAP